MKTDQQKNVSSKFAILCWAALVAILGCKLDTALSQHLAWEPVLNFFKGFIYLFLERGEGREKEGEETSMCAYLSPGPHWGHGSQPRHAPWLGLKPGTSWFAARAQSTEPHQPGKFSQLMKMHLLHLQTVWISNLKDLAELSKVTSRALTSVALLVECHPTEQKVTGLSPCQGTYLGCGLVPVRVCAGGNRSKFLSHIMFLSLYFSLPCPLSTDK